MEFAAFALLVAYLAPWIAAVGRGHERAPLLLAANLALGWTVVGWVALLVAAVRSDAHPSRTRALARRPALVALPGDGGVRRRRREGHLALAEPR